MDANWGYFWAEANFPVGPIWDSMTLAEVSRLEWMAIQRILNRAVQGGHVPTSYTTTSYHLAQGQDGSRRLTYQG
jgi:hypothetical protein